MWRSVLAAAKGSKLATRYSAFPHTRSLQKPSWKAFSTSADIGGTVAGEAPDPSFRHISFDDEKTVCAMASGLRRAWLIRPDPSADQDPDPSSTTQREAIGAFIAEDFKRSEDERAAMPSNPNKDNIKTPWRRAVSFTFNHVLYDTTRFLEQVNWTIGHWHAELIDEDPSAVYGELVVYHDKGFSGSFQKIFDHNVLLIPAFIDPGFSIKVDQLPSAREAGSYPLDERKELGVWDESEQTSIWYIRRDVPVEMQVQRANDASPAGDGTGVAAVFVYAILCNQDYEGSTAKDSAEAH